MALNLGSELAGIVVTVTLIEVLMERRRRQDEIQRKAAHFLQGLDSVIYFWRGGYTKFDIGELLALLVKVEDNDSLIHETEAMLLNLGKQASMVHNEKPDHIASDKMLRKGLAYLAEFLAIRDGANQPVKMSVIAKAAEQACVCLAQAAGIPIPSDRFSLLPPKELCDCSAEGQRKRIYGSLHDTNCLNSATGFARRQTLEQHTSVTHIYDEITSLHKELGSCRIGDRTLLDVIRVVSRSLKGHANFSPEHIMSLIGDLLKNNDLVDNSYWWLCVYGVFRFKEIGEWWTGNTPRWKNSVNFVVLADRGRALFMQLVAEPNA